MAEMLSERRGWDSTTGGGSLYLPLPPCQVAVPCCPAATPPALNNLGRGGFWSAAAAASMLLGCSDAKRTQCLVAASFHPISVLAAATFERLQRRRNRASIQRRSLQQQLLSCGAHCSLAALTAAADLCRLTAGGPRQSRSRGLSAAPRTAGGPSTARSCATAAPPSAQSCPCHPTWDSHHNSCFETALVLQ